MNALWHFRSKNIYLKYIFKEIEFRMNNNKTGWIYYYKTRRCYVDIIYSTLFTQNRSNVECFIWSIKINVKNLNAIIISNPNEEWEFR